MNCGDATGQRRGIEDQRTADKLLTLQLRSRQRRAVLPAVCRQANHLRFRARIIGR